MKLMIDKLEEENPDLFTDKDKTYADLYVKSGLYLTEIVKRLYVGLASQIPDEKARLKHILEKQIYGFAPSEIIYNIAKSFIYGNFADADTANLQCLNLTETAKNGGDLEMKFDVVVGNPPYQEEATGTSTGDNPIYHNFMDLAFSIGEIVELITPGRFLFNAGKTPKAWNKKILADKHLTVKFFEQNSDKVFSNTTITGGVVITYRNRNKVIGPIGIFTAFNELNTIVDKVEAGNFTSIQRIIYGHCKFNMERLYEDYPEYKQFIGNDGHDRRVRANAFDKFEIFSKDKKSKEDFKLLGLVKNERVYRFVDPKYIDCASWINGYKVFVPESNGASGVLVHDNSVRVISKPVLGLAGEGITQTFFAVGNFATQNEAENLLKYVKTKFARLMLGVLKVTQRNNSETWSKVPLQNFTSKSDIDWTKSIPEIDRQLYAKYGLDEKEIAFIEEKVKAME